MPAKAGFNLSTLPFNAVATKLDIGLFASDVLSTWSKFITSNIFELDFPFIPLAVNTAISSSVAEPSTTTLFVSKMPEIKLSCLLFHLLTLVSFI